MAKAHDEAVFNEQAPPVLWPVPIAETRSLFGADFTLIGARVIVGRADNHPGRWLYDQRAATKIHDRNGQRMIGVLSESDWYRQQRDPTYPAIPHSVPVELVYYETTVPIGDVGPRPTDQSDMPSYARCASLVTDPERPPIRWPRRATRERFVSGARCWLIREAGPDPGYRIVGEPRRAEVPTIDFDAGIEGLNTPVISSEVPVYSESNWYRWMDTGELPAGDPVVLAEAALVWLE